MHPGPDAEVPKVIVRDRWIIHDNWWLPKEKQIRREYADVDWNGRRIVFAQEGSDTVWRIKYASSAL